MKKRASILLSWVFYAALLPIFLAAGLLPEREPHAQVSALPLHFEDVVIFATNSVKLRNDVTIVAGHVVVNSPAAALTLAPGVELDLEDRITTPVGYSLAANRISIGSQTDVGGNVFYNLLDNLGTIAGTTSSPLALPVFTTLPGFKSSPPGTQDVTVAKDQIQTLVPGAYRDITVHEGATLKMSPGPYLVRSITASDKARLLFEAPALGNATFVSVANAFSVGDDSVVAPDDADSLKASRIVFYVAGSSNPNGATIGKRSTIQANFYVPNATLTIGDDTEATGQFIAKDVDVGEGARIELEAFGSSAVTITSASSTTFTIGQAGTFTVRTSGAPAVSTILRSGAALPAGINYVDNGDGTATLSGTPSSGTAGSYVFTLTASNGVSPDAVQDPFTLTINQQAQSINFTSSAPAAAVVGGPTYNVTATASSGLPIALSVNASASSVCSIAGSTVSFGGAGTCVIDANQVGNDTYLAAPRVQQSFAVKSIGPDVTPPVIAITIPTNGSVINDRSVTVTGTIDDPTATVRVNGISAAVGGGTFTAQIPLVEGSNTITATATDPANNVGVAQVTVNRPGFGVVTIITPLPLPNSVLAADAPVTISAAFQTTGPLINVSSARLVVNGIDVAASATTSVSGISYHPQQPLPEGTQSVQASIDDGGGGRAVLAWTFITRSLPVVTEVTPQDVTTANNRPPIRALFADVGIGIDAAGVRLLVDGIDVTAQATIDAASVSHTPTNPLGDGAHTASVTIADVAGNSVSRTWTFSVMASTPPFGSNAGTRGTLRTPVIVTPTH